MPTGFLCFVMEKLNLSQFLVALLLFVASPVLAQSPAKKLEQVINKENKKILIAAHRGDWRNTPENSMKALLNCIERGYDIMELDVKMTRDSQLVVMHDNTIDRTTNGSGKVKEFTLAELQKLRLRNGLGRVTTHSIPTLKEMMLAAKDKIIINVDKGNKSLAAVFEILQQTGTIAQTIVNVNDNFAYDQLLSAESIPEQAVLMVVVDMKKPGALAVMNSYKARKRAVMQPIFASDKLSNLNTLPAISKTQVMWLNSLWPSLNGGHDDDLAVEEGKHDAAWGWLIEKGASIIQTDRPLELQEYLGKKQLKY